MQRVVELHQEAQEALQRVWFVQSVEETERTDDTLSLRLTIRPGLFVQAFIGESTGALYLALIHAGRRIYGADRVADEWHLHPYDSPDKHVVVSEGLEPKPLLKFLSQVEDLLAEYSLL